jgi:hypothetical protein
MGGGGKRKMGEGGGVERKVRGRKGGLIFSSNATGQIASSALPYQRRKHIIA